MSNKEILSQFKNVTGELIDLLLGLSQDEMNKTPYQGSWTAAQVGEHLFKSYGVAEVLNGTVQPAKRPASQKLEEVKNLFLNFDIKMKSPKEIVPSNKPKDKPRLISQLKERIAQLQRVIENEDLSKICLDFAIPEYGPFTRLEWIGFCAVHTQRHIHQLKEIITKIKN